MSFGLPTVNYYISDFMVLLGGLSLVFTIGAPGLFKDPEKTCKLSLKVLLIGFGMRAIEKALGIGAWLN